MLTGNRSEVLQKHNNLEQIVNENEFEACRLVYRWFPWRWFSFLRIFGCWFIRG